MHQLTQMVFFSFQKKWKTLFYQRLGLIGGFLSLDQLAGRDDECLPFPRLRARHDLPTSAGWQPHSNSSYLQSFSTKHVRAALTLGNTPQIGTEKEMAIVQLQIFVVRSEAQWFRFLAVGPEVWSLILHCASCE